MENLIQDHLLLTTKLDLEAIDKAANLLIQALQSGKTIYIAGNGGSASDAQHFTAELVGRFNKERKPLSAVCLNADTALVTAIANDYGFEFIFKRQLQGLCESGDVFIAITTSGQSKNVLNAIEWANINGLQTICLTGGKQTEAKLNICVPSNSTARIQEMHILIIHILCQLIEEQYS